MNVILQSNYWPNLNYFYYVLNSNEIIVEQHDHYQKQSFRNRTQILSANGPLNLIIPVHKTSDKILMHEVEIDYKENWQKNHWRALVSAYKNSPYFDFFESEISEFYKNEEKYLLNFNLKQLALILKILRVQKLVNLSESYIETKVEFVDSRFNNHPKIIFDDTGDLKKRLQKKYYQTFSNKFDFIPNLSILDLIFNEGKNALDYLLAE